MGRWTRETGWRTREICRWARGTGRWTHEMGRRVDPPGRTTRLAAAVGTSITCIACLVCLGGCRDEPEPAVATLRAELPEVAATPAPDTLDPSHEVPTTPASDTADLPSEAPATPVPDTLELPQEARTFLAADTVRAERLGEGVHYHYRWAHHGERGPWAVHLVSADLTRCDLQLRVVPAEEENGPDRRSRKTVAEMRPTGSVAGVNGDFFMEGGMPLGPEVTPAGTWRASSRPAFVWTSRRTPWIGSAERTGRVMVFGADTVGGPGDADGGVQVVGGYPELLDGGARVGDLAVGARPAFADARHPRTAVGWDHETQRLWLLVVDGRTSHSDGMTLPELTELLEKLGVDEALNLDGGGSSTMALGDRTANHPSDTGGQRQVANSLWLVEDASGCPGA